MTVQVLIGDCRDVLRSLPAESVHCCVTSPPYFGLRDYGTGTWEGGDQACDHRSPTMRDGRNEDRATLAGSVATNSAQLLLAHRSACGKCGAIKVDRQIGLEPSPDEFIATMVAVFREVRRVLRADGTCWLNLGDSYATQAGKNNGNLVKWSAANAAGGGHRAGDLDTPTLPVPAGAKAKDLLMIPARVALALQADGWWLRSDIIWAKKNCMPESVRDRPTSAHEHVFLLTKSARYFYDAQAVAEAVQRLPEDTSEGILLRAKERDHREPVQAVLQGPRNGVARDSNGAPEIAGRKPVPGRQGEDGALLRLAEGQAGDYAAPCSAKGEEGWRGLHADKDRMGGNQGAGWEQVPLLPAEDGPAGDGPCNPTEQGRASRRVEHRTGMQKLQQPEGNADSQPALRNLRNVWNIATAPFPLAHFATYPPALVEPCIKAGTSERGCCPACGAPWAREVEQESRPNWQGGHGQKHDGTHYRANPGGGVGNDSRERRIIGWSPSCSCPPAAPIPCTVLDCFGGAGTTGLVADRLQRNAILIELNPEYAAMARRRITSDAPLLQAAQ